MKINKKSFEMTRLAETLSHKTPMPISLYTPAMKNENFIYYDDGNFYGMILGIYADHPIVTELYHGQVACTYENPDFRIFVREIENKSANICIEPLTDGILPNGKMLIIENNDYHITDKKFKYEP